MKTSLVLKPRRNLSRKEAWGCLTANIVLPGSGSLLAGHAVGYAQAAVAGIGLCLSTITCSKLMFWYFQNFYRLQPETPDDVLMVFQEIWVHLKWPLISMAVFLVALLWSVVTSIAILRASQKEAPVPPVIRN